MAEMPKTVVLELNKKQLEQVELQMSMAKEVFFKEGLAQGRKEMLDFLEEAYINDPGRPDRDSPKGKAILELARGLGRHIRALEKGQK